MVTQGARITAAGSTAAGPDDPRWDGEYDDPGIEYPSSDGERMAESDLQFVPLTDTVIILRLWFAQRSDVYVAGDMLVYYRMNDNGTRVAPDVFVVFGALGKHPRDSWLVWREGKAPDFVLEIASPSTWERDAEEKRRIYAAMGVAEYWRFDPTGECFAPPLVGETLVGGEYRGLPLEGDGAGMVWAGSDLLGLDICVLPGLALRLYDRAGGRWLLTPEETEAARRLEEEARMAAEAALRESEAALRESDAARLSAEAARLAAEAESARLREQLRALQSGQ